MSYLFKYLARYIVRDLATFLEPYQVRAAQRVRGSSFGLHGRRVVSNSPAFKIILGWLGGAYGAFDFF